MPAQVPFPVTRKPGLHAVQLPGRRKEHQVSEKWHAPQVSFSVTYESGGPASPHQATLLLRHRGGGGTALFADRGAKGRAPGSYAIEASPAALAKQLGPLVRVLYRFCLGT